jgi:autotransporter translocation and assembly factor TamB
VGLDDGKVDDFVIGDVNGLVSLGPQGVSFSELEVDAAEGRLTLDGSVEFDDRLSIRATARLDRIELAHLLENVTLDGAQVTQRTSGTATVKGELDPLKLDVTTSLEVADHTVLSDGFREPGREVLLYLPRATVAGRLRIDDRSVVANGLDVRFGDSQVDVKMRFNLEAGKGWELEARSDRFDLDDLKRIAGLEVAGQGSVSCRIVDPEYGDPRITGRVRFQRATLAGFDLDEISAGVRFSGKELLFDDVSARSGQSAFSSQVVALDFGGRAGLKIQAKVEAERVAIEDLARTFHLDTRPFGSPTGFLYGRAAIDYSARPENLRIEAKLDHDRLEVFGERFGTDSLSFVWDHGALTVDRLDAAKGGGRISITGAVARDGTLNFMGVARQVALSSIDDPSVRSLALEGLAQAFVVITGTLAHPEGEADVRLSEITRLGRKYGPSHLELRLDGDVVTGRGALADRMVVLEYGRLDLGSKTFRVEGFAEELDLIDALDVDTRGQQVAAEITGEVMLTGSLVGDLRLTGHATLSAVRIAINDFEFRNRDPVTIVANRDRFTLERTRFRGKDVTFDLSGRAGLDQIQNLAIVGVMDLGSIADMVEPVTGSAGKIFFDGRVKGSWADPLFRGEARVEGGRFSIDGFPSPIEEVSGKIVLGARKISFADFTGRSAGGDLEMAGQMTLAGLKIEDYRFMMTIADMELKPFEDLSLRASTTKGGLVLKPGDRDLPTVTGDLEISDLRYTEDIRMIEISDLSVDRLTGTKLRAKRPRTFDEKKDKIAFDIRLHGSRGLEVKNNVVDASIRIDDVEEPLRLVGTNQSYGFLGRILGIKGQVRFAGKTFDVRYAAVSFRDPLRPDNPGFRITADGQVRDWKVTITASGTVDDYEVKITSQPYLSQEDLVYLLLTGMTKAEHLQFGSQGITSIGTPLLSTMGGDLIPLEVRIYTEYSEKAGTDTTRISLGKWITENIWAAFSSSLGEERDIEANIDYRINDNLSISVDFDNESQTGNLGIDLKYRKEF